MDRNTAIVVTVFSVFLCTCPGLMICALSGLMFLATGEFYGTDQQIITGLAIAALVFGLFLSLIPIAVGYFTLRSRSEKTMAPIDIDEPLPPPI